MIRINAPAEPLLTIGELAAALKRAESYVWAMRRGGFQMPGGRATLSEARKWLHDNPEPRGLRNCSKSNNAEAHGSTRKQTADTQKR